MTDSTIATPARLTDKRLGPVGESQLRLWIASADGSASPPAEDVFGWDFHVELPIALGTGPIDRSSAKLAAYIQVKSTRSPECVFKISLRNMKFAADDPAPFFFLFLQFDSDGANVVRAHLTHFSERLISQTLRRIRTAEFLQKRKWRSETITVKPEPDDELVAPYDFSLAERLRTVIGDPREYSRWKTAVNDSVGYGEFRQSVDVSFEAIQHDDPVNMLISAALGKKVRLTANSVTIRDLRFDMPVIERQDAGGIVELVHEGNPDWILELGDADSGPRVTWPVRMYSTNGLTELVGDLQHQVAWRNDFIECLVCEQENGYRLQLTALELLEAAPTWGQLQDLASTYRILADAKNLDVRFKRLSPPLPAAGGVSKMPDNPEADDLHRVAKVLEDLAAVTSQLGHLFDVRCPVQDLLSCERELGFLAALAKGEKLFVRVSPINRHAGKIGTKVAAVPVLRRSIGDMYLVASMPVIGNLSRCHSDRDRLQLENECHELGQVRFLPKAELEADWHVSMQEEGLKLVPSPASKLVLDFR